jgi:hypothetical protein
VTHPALHEQVDHTVGGTRLPRCSRAGGIQQILLAPRLYQLDATVRDELPATTLSSPALRRLSAEQIWDSILTLTVDDVDRGVNHEPRADWSYLVAARNAKSPDELEQLIVERAKSLSGRGEIAKRNSQKARQRQQDGFLRENLRRASELPQPAPAGHFLSQFGQAERSTIEDQWMNATTPQALTLLNGSLLREVVRPGSPLETAWQKARNKTAKTEAVYRLVLGRSPSDAERKLINRKLDLSTALGFQKLTWSLINSREFLFLY